MNSYLGVKDGSDLGDWCGTYFSNDGQIVTTEDAAALADALEKALEDIKDFEVSGKLVSLQAGDKVEESVLGSLHQISLDAGHSITFPDSAMHPFEYFGGEMKQRVISFIKLCRKGAFTIL